jgi:hypothetical protein
LVAGSLVAIGPAAPKPGCKSRLREFPTAKLGAVIVDYIFRRIYMYPLTIVGGAARVDSVAAGALEDIVRPRLQSRVCARPLNSGGTCQPQTEERLPGRDEATIGQQT